MCAESGKEGWEDGEPVGREEGQNTTLGGNALGDTVSAELNGRGGFGEAGVRFSGPYG